LFVHAYDNFELLDGFVLNVQFSIHIVTDYLKMFVFWTKFLILKLGQILFVAELGRRVCFRMRYCLLFFGLVRSKREYCH